MLVAGQPNEVFPSRARAHGRCSHNWREVGSALDDVGHPSSNEVDYGSGFFAVFLVFALVGAVVAFRRPANPLENWLERCSSRCKL